MSAVPGVNYPQPQESPSPQRAELRIHQPEERPVATRDDLPLAGMLLAGIAFAVAFAAFVVIPYMSQWLAL